MLGPQHKQFNIPFSILIILTLIGALNFNIMFLLSIPIGIFMYSFPDIDADKTPKRWKMIKNLWIALIFSVFIIALVATGYFGYNIFTQKMKYEDVIQYFGLSLGIVIIYILGFKYASSKGKWLTAHRGFTHRLIMVVIPMIVFYQLNNLLLTADKTQTIIIKITQILLLGISIGILGHQILDLTCKVGIKGWLWPLLPNTTISIGKAISSDPKRPGKAHKSSIITTNFWCLVCYILIIIVIIVFKNQYIDIFKTLIQFKK